MSDEKFAVVAGSGVHKIYGEDYETETRVCVRNQKLVVEVVRKGDGKPLQHGSLGGEVVALHRVLQLLAVLPVLDGETFSAAVLVSLRQSPALDSPNRNMRTQRARKIEYLKTFLDSDQLDAILGSYPVSILAELIRWRSLGVQLKTADVTDALENNVYEWIQQFDDLGVETPEARTVRRQAAAAEERRRAQLSQEHEAITRA